DLRGETGVRELREADPALPQTDLQLTEVPPEEMSPETPVNLVDGGGGFPLEERPRERRAQHVHQDEVLSGHELHAAEEARCKDGVVEAGEHDHERAPSE